jgi:hypothetical protein
LENSNTGSSYKASDLPLSSRQVMVDLAFVVELLEDYYFELKHVSIPKNPSDHFSKGRAMPHFAMLREKKACLESALWMWFMIKKSVN